MFLIFRRAVHFFHQKETLDIYNVRLAIISSDDRVKYLRQDCKSVVKQVSATDHKS